MGEFMRLQQELALRAAHIDDISLLYLMGYRHPTLKSRQRLRTVLADSMLGLRSSAFDFRYSSDAFVKALADALGADKIFVELELAEIRQQIETYENRFVPRIFVDTGFRRTTQPIFALAACEHQREIGLSDDEMAQYERASVPERIRILCERVRRHYIEHSGFLGIWGFIQHYVVQLDPQITLKVLSDGTVREEVAFYEDRPRATLNYKGKPVLRRMHEQREM